MDKGEFEIFLKYFARIIRKISKIKLTQNLQNISPRTLENEADFKCLLTNDCQYDSMLLLTVIYTMNDKEKIELLKRWAEEWSKEAAKHLAESKFTKDYWAGELAVLRPFNIVLKTLK